MAIAVLALGIVPPAGATPLPTYAQYGDWILGCDNVGRCEARGFVDTLPYADLRMTREAGEAMPEIRLLASGRAAMPVPLLDGTPLPAWPQGWRLVTLDGDATATTRDPAVVAAFIGQAGVARRLDFGDGPQGVPLTGMQAALLRMDDLQGRIGTATPLVASRGAGRAPLAPPLPRSPPWGPRHLSRGEAEPLLAAARREGAAALRGAECERGRPGIPPDEAHALDTATALVLLGCGSSAYQDWSVALLVTRTSRRVTVLRLALPTYPPPDAILMNGGFEARTGMLGVLNKGRGMADCGMAASWAWSAGAFRLTSLNRRDRCGGEPGDWLTLYRTAP